ncbi:hypothetical protein BDZ91DRAFT_758224 [Kalaharituber pfeilii]|nr:hypothetical protein BDZ91DRAFT_758224 [Kalaharituber pfeilii]
MDSSSAAATPASPLPSAAEQARIRRERRQAKIKAEGSSRLNRITSTQSSSRLYEAAAETSPQAAETPLKAPSSDSEPTYAAPKLTPPATSSADGQHEDPPDVVLSDHYYKPAGKSKVQDPARFSPSLSYDDPLAGPSEAEMKELIARYGGGGGAGAVGGGQLGMQEMPGMVGTGAEDPMMALLQQMLGVPPPQVDAASVQAPPPQQQQEDKWGKWWRTLHALCALILAIVSLRDAGFGGHFDGSLKQRVEREEETSHFFYYFATMELILQTSSDILVFSLQWLSLAVVAKGRPPPGSILSMLGQALPKPFGNYLITIARYSNIWTTILNDAFLIVFVFGMVAWWNSQ